MRYFLVAGEASGDLHAGELIKSLRKVDPDAVFAFMGGAAMEKAAECKPVLHYSAIAYMGFLSVLKHYGTIRKAARQVPQQMLHFAPDCLIVVDSSGFNLRYILPFATKKLPQTKRFYYIAPKVWAWQSRRIRKIRKYCHLVLSILPFEENYFQSRSVPCCYVGNPTREELHSEYLSSWKPTRGMDHKELIALLPGSRRQEIRNNLQQMVRVANSFPSYHFTIAAAPGIEDNFYYPFLEKNITIVRDSTYSLLAKARAALVTSGTATLETALIGTPQVVVYRLNGLRIVNILFRILMHIPYFSLVNLIAGRKVVAELLAADASVQRITSELDKLLQPSAEHALIDGYNEVYRALGTKQASSEAAKCIFCYRLRG